MTEKIKINRAPVLTLWAAVVAEQLGYPQDTALTLGKAVAGLNAQSKGQRLGIYEPSEEKPAKSEKEAKTPPASGPEQSVHLLGRSVAVIRTDQGLFAQEKEKAMDPRSVEKYLQQKFKETLPEVRQAMKALAQSVDTHTLERRGYDWYETFRPAVPEGKRGWGAAGELDLTKIQALARGKKEESR